MGMDRLMTRFSVGGFVATLGVTLNLMLGGWDVALKLLVSLMVLDYITGVLAAIRKKTLNSDVMFWGGIRKGLVLAVVMLAVLLDQRMGNQVPLFRSLALYYYSGREGLSVVENFGLLGVPLPKWLKAILAQLQEQGDSGNTSKEG